MSGSDWGEWTERTLGEPVRAGAADSATLALVLPGNAPIVRVWGHRDLDGRAAAAPTDRFLIASVTKIFTASLIARLLQDGRIASLDDPANRYLKRIQLPSRDGREITVRHLLTHTAGFEERGFGMARAQGMPITASPEDIRSRLPALVRRPGESIVYANIDPPLLGVLMEDVTGRSYRELLRDEVLTPLGMGDTDVNYAIDLGPDVARAGMPDGRGGRRAQPVHANAPFFAPTGSIQTTAGDMARFLEAQLGRRPDLFDEAALTRLHTPLARNAQGLGSLAMAFFVDRWNEAVVVSHPGLFSGYSANLVLVPELGAGLFVAWAGAPGPGVKPLDLNAVRDAFLLHLLGSYRAPPRIANPPDTTAFSGRYWRERRPQTNAEALVAAQAILEVRGSSDGSLRVGGDEPWFAIGPGLYQQAGDGSRLPRTIWVDGDQVRLQSDVARRVSGLTDPGVLLKIAAVSLIVLLTGFLAAWYARGATRVASIAAGVIALSTPLLVLGPSPSGLDLEGEIIAGVWFRLGGLALAAWLLTAAASILMSTSVSSALAAVALKPSRRPRMARAHLALLTLAALALLAVMWAFHLPLGP